MPARIFTAPMDEMKQPSSADSEGEYSSIAWPSSALYYRQSEPRSITGIHQTINENHEIVIEIQPSGSNFYTIDGSNANVISAIVKERNLGMLSSLGGVVGMAATLKTSLKDGIGGSSSDISHRQGTFGSNTFDKLPAKSFLHFVWESSQDSVVLFLLVCAMLSLVLGIKIDGLREGWFDGGSIFFAVSVVISASAMASFMMNRQLAKIFETTYCYSVIVIRDGSRQQISMSEVVVGDVVLLKVGDQVPADGLFVEGYSLQIDESSMTGESDPVEINLDQNPFLRSGAMVAAGYAKMLVTSVGMNTEYGELMSTISQDSREETPLEARVHKLAISAGTVGLVVAFTIFLMLLVRYVTGHSKDEDGRVEFIVRKTKAFVVIKHVVEIVAVVAAILHVAIPEDLPLGVRYILSYSAKRLMMNDEAVLVRNLSAFEAVSSVTTLSMDISAIHTSNRMKVITSCLGKEWIEERSHSPISPNVLQLLFQGISLARSSTVRQFLSVTATDDAIHSWAVLELNMEMNVSTSDFSILDIKPSRPESRVGILVKNQLDQMIHAHWKGDAEIILSSCSHYQDEIGNIITLDDQERGRFHQIMEDMAANSIRFVAFAHKQISQDEYENNRNIPDNGLVLLGIVGLKAPYQPGVKGAIAICQQAGINIQAITSENASLAKAMCMNYGIVSQNQDGSMVEGREFCNYTDKERIEIVENISVMPRASPLDKLLTVRCLKEKGHVVAVAANSRNDAPALAEANVGISFGATGMVKESSDIVIMGENFASIVKVLRWSRCVYSNIQKHIQFQLTVYASALITNLVTAAFVGKAPLTPAQLLWVSLIMGTLGPLALATEEPTTDLMKKPPVNCGDMLITNIMCRNITVQALYQITVVFALKLKGKSNDTLVFTTFVLCQVFNLFNARKLEEKNVLRGILRNKMLLAISGAIIIIQVAMVEVLNKIAHTERLDWKQWGLCVGIAAVTWPVGVLSKFLPVPDMDTIFNYLRRTRTVE